MDKNKQIEKMENIINFAMRIPTANFPEQNVDRYVRGYRFKIVAEVLYENDYRKQSETAKEILDEVSKHFGGAWLVELYKKYGVE